MYGRSEMERERQEQKASMETREENSCCCLFVLWRERQWEERERERKSHLKWSPMPNAMHAKCSPSFSRWGRAALPWKPSLTPSPTSTPAHALPSPFPLCFHFHVHVPQAMACHLPVPSPGDHRFHPSFIFSFNPVLLCFMNGIPEWMNEWMKPGRFQVIIVAMLFGEAMLAHVSMFVKGEGEGTHNVCLGIDGGRHKMEEERRFNVFPSTR